jgi:hypothetical protein
VPPLEPRRSADADRDHGGDPDRDLESARAPEQRLEPSEQRADVPQRAAAAQLARKRAPCAEEQRLDGALREVELSRDLRVREALPLAQQNRAPLRFS